MPAPIRRIAQTHLKSPEEVTIRSSTSTVKAIRQRYWLVSGVHKLDALTRILEAEAFEAMIVFARTKLGTEELAERLQARGFAAAAINGDLIQAQREKTIARLKEGQLDILVATDVAARGLDVERISHVLNYDIPYDSEAYVHRIGRTGRAGRSGDAILFVTPRERHLLRAIERATRQPIEQMHLPTVQAVNDRRIARFHKRISEGLEAGDLDLFRSLISDYAHQNEVAELDIAAALARMLQGKTPLLLAPGGDSTPADEPRFERTEHAERPRSDRGKREPVSKFGGPDKPRFARSEDRAPMERSSDRTPVDRGAEARPPRAARPPRVSEAAGKLEKFRVEVGHKHGVKPGNLVGAIANEAGLESQFMGRIEIEDDYSIVELPEGMPKDVFLHLKKVWVVGRPLRISRLSDAPDTSASDDLKPQPHRAPRKPGDKPPRRRQP